MKISGMVTQERIWDTRAMPEATLVSLPRPLGTMIVLRPRGIAREQTAQVAKTSGKGIRSITPMKSSGNTSSRRNVAT